MFRKGHRHPLLSRNLFPDGSAQVTEWVLCLKAVDRALEPPREVPGLLPGFPLGRVPVSPSFVLCLSGLEGLSLRTSPSHEGMGINLLLTRNTL